MMVFLCLTSDKPWVFPLPSIQGWPIDAETPDPRQGRGHVGLDRGNSPWKNEHVNGRSSGSNLPSGYVKIAIEAMAHRNSGFSH